MDSFVDKLIGDIGCNLDATSTNNPLAQWANNIIDSNIGFHDTISAGGTYNLEQTNHQQTTYDIIETDNVNSSNYLNNNQVILFNTQIQFNR